jgi:hypothetical protein
MENISETIEKIYAMIESGENIEAFDLHFKTLSIKAPFIGMEILNEFLFRARKDEGEIIDHIAKMKYPPVEYAKKGRLNDNGESIAYLSSGELAPLAEINIGYYELYCNAKIQYFKKDIIFHLVGVKKDKIEITPPIDNETFSLYRELITTKDKKVYNATIALARHLFSSKGFKAGIIYSSVQEDKSNQNLFNLAIGPEDFDECCKIIELEYNILRYVPDEDHILIDTINKGAPIESGEIKWELSYSDMMEKLNKKIDGEVFKINNGIVHYKFGGGLIENETEDSFLVKFTRTNSVEEIHKSEVKNI